jgi:hypothetical protein
LRFGIFVRYSVPLVHNSGFCALAQLACFIISDFGRAFGTLERRVAIVCGYTVRCLGRRMLRGADCRLSG